MIEQETGKVMVKPQLQRLKNYLLLYGYAD